MGMVKCEACKGGGRCPSCDGIGWVYSPGTYIRSLECSLCHRTGLCTVCGGTGKVEETVNQQNQNEVKSF